MPPRLTIAIPFYRGHTYLRAAIESALRQTTPDWVLHVYDDCGPEPGTQHLVDRFRDDRIRYSRNATRLGIAGNWNRCLEGAETELVTLLHADDELRPDYAAVMTAAAERHPQAVAVFCGADIIGPTGARRFSLADAVKRYLWRPNGEPSLVRGRPAIEALCHGNFLMCPTACYRRSRLGPRRFDETWKFVLDLDLFTRLLFEGEHFVLLPDLLYAYRRHPENTTELHTRTLQRFEEEFAIYRRLAAAAREKKWHRAAHRAEACVLIRLNLFVRAWGDLVHGRVGAAINKLLFLVNRS